nr:hypothetical protein [Micromonospora sp. DSM 115978]
RDGDLYVSGRRKEMIVVRGVNYYPEDAEAAVRDLPGVHRGRCVAVADVTTPVGSADAEADPDGKETITIVAETGLTAPADQARLSADLRVAVTTALGVPDVTVLVVAPDTLPRTSSGKFQRLAARDLVRTRRK